MNGIWTVARMTMLDARRNRVAWSLALFCVVLVLNSFLFQEVTIAAYDRIIRDVSLAAINGFGLLFAVFLGVTAVNREIERKTVYWLLTKPLGRIQYLIGKLLGVWLTIVASLSLMMVVFVGETLVLGAPIGRTVFQAFWLMLMEFLLIASFSILASTFASTVVSAFMSIGLFLIGHLSPDLQYFSSKATVEIVRKAGAGLFYLLPNLQRLNLKTEASLLAPVKASLVASESAYALLYTVAFLVLASLVFVRRDLK